MKILEKINKKQVNLVQNEPITIAFLGDSVTQGCFECYLTSPTTLETVFDYDSSYSTRLRSLLNMLYPNVQINIINSGISGDSAPVGLERLERDALRYRPDLVVVGFALNDACGGEENLPAYENAMREIVRRVMASGAECILLTPNMMNTKTSVHLTDELFRGLAGSFAEVQNDGMLDRYVDTIRKIAAEEGAVLCDVYAKWKAMAKAGVDTTELLANKLNHPIRKLHEMTAFMLCECLFEK